MEGTLTPRFGPLMLVLLFCLSGGLYAQNNLTPVAGSTQTINVPSSGYTSFSDPGGPGGTSSCSGVVTGTAAQNYPNCGCLTTVTVCHDITGTPVEIDFTEFGVNAYFDYVIVYDGNTTAGTVLYNNTTGGAQYNDACFGPGLVVANNPSGCLTIEFNASTVVEDAGFIANIIAGPVGDNEAGVTIVNPTNPTTATLQNVQVTLNNSGSNTLNTATIEWEINGTPQTPYSYTGPALASGTSSAPITIGTITPASGDSIKAWSSMPNGVADTVNVNDTSVVNLCIGLTGTFTIDAGLPTSSTNFASFQEAIDTMMLCGIAGPIVFNVEPLSGPYNEQITIPEIVGSSATNTVTFNGNGDTLEYNATSGDKFTLRFDGADYIIIDSLYIRSLNSTYGNVLQFSNASDNNIIRKSTVDASSVTSTSTTNSSAISFSGSTSSNAATGDNGSFNLIEDNQLINGYYGIRFNTGGRGNNTIRNNVVHDSYSYGIYVAGDNNNTLIEGNDIGRPTRSTVTTWQAIYFTGSSENCVVRDNIIHNTNGASPTSTSAVYGIYFTSCDATVGNENWVYNNLIYDLNNNGTAYGLYSTGSDGLFWYHNTVSIDNAAATTSAITRGFYQGTAATNVKLIGNIISITRGGTGTNTGLYISNLIAESNYNVVYVNSPAATNLFGYDGTDRPTLLDWQSNTFLDANSYDVNPFFVNAAGGDYTPGNPTFNNVVPNQGIATDIFGTARGTNTDPGAIEFFGVPNDIGVFNFVSPLIVVTSGTESVDVEVRNFGTNTVNNFNLDWSVNGTPQTGTSSSTPIGPSTNSSPINLGTYTPTSRDTIRAWTSQPNGVADAFPLNDTLTIITCVGMQGTYTINAGLPTGGTNFVSFTDAVDSMLSCGITGPVVFDVVPLSGPYTEQVTIPLINGVSATNTITFNGNGDTLEFSPASSAKYIVKLDGARYVTLDSLVIRSVSGLYGFGVLLSGDAQFNTVRKSVIDVSLVTSTTASNSTGVAISGSNTSPTSNSILTGSNNLIENNTIIGGYQGVSVFGNSDGTGADNNRFIGNVIHDFYNAGVLLSDNTNTVIEGNDISRPTRVGVTTFHGVELASNAYGALVNANRIHNTHGAASSLTGSVYGIYFTSSDADSARPNVVSNNLIYDINHNGVFYGVYNSGSDNNRVVHNTIVLNQQNATGSSATRGFYQTTAAFNVHFKNNIIYIVRDGNTQSKYGVYLNMGTGDITVDNNVYYINSTTGTNYVGYYDVAGYETLAQWQTADGGAYDQNGFERNPRFVDIVNHDYTPTSTVINDEAEPVGILTDFFGAPRSVTMPDPGAIEFVPLADDAATIALLSPQQPFAPGNYPIDVVIQNLGAADLTEVDIYVNINDGVLDTTLPVYAHSPILLPSLASDTVTIGSFDFTSQSYTITVWTSNPNGGTDANTANDTLVVNVCLALPAGNYTINSAVATGGGNYQSFTDAAAALACGILGDVTFTVAPGSGPYSEQVSIGEIPGVGPTAQVVFDGQDQNDIVLTHDGSVKFATLSLLGSDYVTIQNMTVENTSNLQGFGIHLSNQADNITIRNTTVSMSTTVTNSINAAIVASASETSATAEGNTANNLWVDSCTLRGGYRGLVMEGSATELVKGNRITNSTLVQQYNAAVYIDDLDSFIVHNNYVDSLRDGSNGDGLYLFDMNGYFEVTENEIYVPDFGAYINDANNLDSTRRAKIVNNMIRSNSDYGLYFVSSSHIDIFHNTVVGNPAIYMTTNTKRLDIRNNIFYSFGDYAFEDAVAVGTSNHLDIDNNIYYTSSTSVFVEYGGVDYANLAAWQAAVPAFNQNSLVGDPVFVSFNDLHILGTLPNGAGDNTVGITVDIDGDARPLAPSATVDIGADEYLPFTTNIAVVDIISPTTNSCGDSTTPVTVVIYNYGTQAQSNFDVEVEVTGSQTQTLTTTYAGPIASETFDTIVVGTLNTYGGGNYTLFAEHMLAGDQFPGNDTMSTTVDILPIPAAPTAVGDTGCVGEFLELTADMTGWVDLEWFDDAALTNSVGSGDVFFTPALSSTETYYVVGSQGLEERAGKPTLGSGGNFITSGGGWGLEFEVTAPVTIESVNIYAPNSGTLTLTVWDLDNGNAQVWVGPTLNITGNPGVAQRIPVGFAAAPGRYALGIDSYSGVTLERDLSGATPPYGTPSGSLVVTGGKQGYTSLSTSLYYWFYDWIVTIPGCTSPAQEVTAFISDTQSDAGPNDTICAGETATLTAQNGVSWLWTGGLNTQTINVSPATTTTYGLTVIDDFGCTGTLGQTTVIVNQLPNVDAGNDTAVCAGETVTFGAIGATSYVWSNSSISSTISVSTAGIYGVTGTDANGCVNTDEVELTVRALPAGNAGADEEICVGGSVQLVATGGVSYAWSTGETTADITVSPVATTPYNLTTTNQFGCVGEDTVTVVVNALPVINITVSDTICITQTNLALTATPSGGTFTGPGVSGGVFDASIVGVGTYTLTYSYTDGNGCSNTATKQVVVDASQGCVPGIGNLAGIEEIGVYPNPFQDEVSIQFTAISSEPVTISMYNLLGQVIFTADVEVTYGLNSYTIETDRSLAEGFYVIELRKGNESYMEKLLRVR